MNSPDSPRNPTADAICSERNAAGCVDRRIGEIAFVVAVTLVGGWLRFRALGWDSLWFDEVFSAQQAHLPFWDLLQSIRQDPHPPLYHLLLRSVLTLGDSEAVLRFPSALFGTLSIPAVYLLGRAWFSGSVGALAALLLALSTGHLWHSQDARMYTLLTFEGILSWYLFGKLLDAPSRAIWAGYFLTAGAIFYTHYYGVLLLLSQTALVFLLSRRGEVDRSFCARWVVVQSGLALLILPWAVFAATSIQLERIRWIEEYHPLAQVVGGFVRFTTGYPGMAKEVFEDRRLASTLALLCGLLVIGAAAAALLRDESGKPRTLRAAIRERPVLLCLWYLTAPIAMILAISLFRPLLAPRYMLMTAPAFLLLVALGLTRLLPGWMIFAAALIVALLVPGLFVRLSTPRTGDYRGAAALIAGKATPGDVLLTYDEHRRLPLEHYLRSRESEFRWCPRSVRDTSPDATRGCLDEARRVWMVSRDPPSRAEEGRPDPSALEDRFKLIRSDRLFKTHIFLYERQGVELRE